MFSPLGVSPSMSSVVHVHFQIVLPSKTQRSFDILCSRSIDEISMTARSLLRTDRLR